MIRTVRKGTHLKVEYEGILEELVDDYTAILKGLLANDDTKQKIREVSKEIIDDSIIKDMEMIEESLK